MTAVTTASVDLRPRIIVVAQRIDDSGGMERVHAELIRRMAQEFRFTIVANMLAEDLQQTVDWIRIPLPPAPAPFRFLVFYCFAGVRLRIAKPALVHVCGALIPNRADLASVHFCHAGFVRTNTGHLAPAGTPFFRRVNTSIHRCLAILAEQWSYRPKRLRLLAPVSHQVAEELIRGYPGVAIEETPNGVDLERFAPDSVARQVVRGRLGVDDETIVVLFVGGDWDRKGLADAIQAVALAQTMGGHLRLWIVGAGDQERFEGYAQVAGVASAIQFLGQRSDPESYYQSADIYLCCSAYEPFSLALLEAAACGLPFVTTKVGVSSALLADPVDPGGVLVERNSEEAAAALHQLASDAQLRLRYSAAARRAAEGFGWEHLVDRMGILYRELLSTIGVT